MFYSIQLHNKYNLKNKTPHICSYKKPWKMNKWFSSLTTDLFVPSISATFNPERKTDLWSGPGQWVCRLTKALDLETRLQNLVMNHNQTVFCSCSWAFTKTHTGHWQAAKLLDSDLLFHPQLLPNLSPSLSHSATLIHSWALAANHSRLFLNLGRLRGYHPPGNQH